MTGCEPIGATSAGRSRPVQVYHGWPISSANLRFDPYVSAADSTGIDCAWAQVATHTHVGRGDGINVCVYRREVDGSCDRAVYCTEFREEFGWVQPILAVETAVHTHPTKALPASSSLRLKSLQEVIFCAQYGSQ